jgi:hypothetical protein
LSLEKGITRIAQDLENDLPEGLRVAVVNFESPSARFGDFVLEELQGDLVNGKKLVVTERSKLELLRNELSFQMSGEVSDESAVSIGHWLGAQVIITGSLSDLGGAYRCRFNAIDIETAVREVSPAVTIENDRAIACLLPAGTAPPPPAQVPAKPDPAPATACFNSGFAHYEAGRYAEARIGSRFYRSIPTTPRHGIILKSCGEWDSESGYRDYQKAQARRCRVSRYQETPARRFLRDYAHPA